MTETEAAEIKTAITTGKIFEFRRHKLEEYSTALATTDAYTHFSEKEFMQVCETVRMIMHRSHIEALQNHVVELHNHITKLNSKNSITQYCVIALTIAALIGTVAQVWYAKKADQRYTAEQQQTITAQEAKN